VSARVRIGVIGGGLVAQAVHLPNLARLQAEFELVAIADASPTVATGLASRYSEVAAYTDWQAMLERETLDAVLIASPNATHAAATLAALDAGVHVLVEKPLCIDPADAERICERCAHSGLVVQVGYMKRFHPAYQALLEDLPNSAERLRLINVVTYDPWLAREPFVPWEQMVHAADDIPAAASEALRESERQQVKAAVGLDDERAVRAYSYTFLACLIHDLNLVHGVLDRLGVEEPLKSLQASDWADGNGCALTAQLPTGTQVQLAWVLLPRLLEFRGLATFFFEDAVHELRFPAPYDPAAPARYSVGIVQESRPVSLIQDVHGNAFVAELEHFHRCIVSGEPCRCPPEDAKRDIELIRAVFLQPKAPTALPHPWRGLDNKRH
jgi:predicted dehydrogenase